MKNYKHAKVAPAKGISLNVIAAVLAMTVIGVVSAKSLSTPDKVVEVSATTTTTQSKCSALISGYQCRLDAAIEAATR